MLRQSFRVFPECHNSYNLSDCHCLCDLTDIKSHLKVIQTFRSDANYVMVQMTSRWLYMSAPIIRTVVFTQITTRNSYLYNPEKPSTLKITVTEGIKRYDSRLFYKCLPNENHPNFLKYLGHRPRPRVILILSYGLESIRDGPIIRTDFSILKP